MSMEIINNCEFSIGVKTTRNQTWTCYNNVAKDDKADIDLKGKLVCITGTFAKTRNKIIKELEDNGVIVKKSVVKNLDYLIAGVDGGSKVIKAQEKNIPIIGEKALNSFLHEDLSVKPVGLPKPVELLPQEEELSEDELVF